MARFIVEVLPTAGETFTLERSLVKHARALRLRAGDALTLMDGRGGVRQIRILQAQNGVYQCQALKEGVSEGEARALTPFPTVYLIQALPKGSKLYSIVRMATELGVHAIHLAFSKRTIAQPSETRFASRLLRLREIAKEASAVAGRRHVPQITLPDALIEVANRAPEQATKWVCWEQAQKPLLPLALDVESLGEVWIIVGPEGGFSVEEINHLRGLGYQDVRLGPWTLRVETAAPAALAIALAALAARA